MREILSSLKYTSSKYIAHNVSLEQGNSITTVDYIRLALRDIGKVVSKERLESLSPVRDDDRLLEGVISSLQYAQAFLSHKHRVIAALNCVQSIIQPFTPNTFIINYTRLTCRRKQLFILLIIGDTQKLIATIRRI